MLNAKDFGVSSTNYDNSLPLKIALQECRNQGDFHLVLPPGNLIFRSSISIDFGLTLEGSGMLNTVLVREFNAGGGIGLLNFYEGSSGFSLSKLAINSHKDYFGGSAFRVKASPNNGVSGFNIEDIYVSTFGSNNWDIAVDLDGSEKVTGAIGNRTSCIRNMHVFGAANTSVRILKAVGLTWTSGGVYSAGGTGSLTGSIHIDDDSWYVNICLSNITGTLKLGRCRQSLIQLGTMNKIENTSQTLYTTVLGYCQDVQTNWQYSKHL